jgi:hypothetical protein
MAENQYGTSDPALTTDPVKARHPFGMYPLHKNMENIAEFSSAF